MVEFCLSKSTYNIINVHRTVHPNVHRNVQRTVHGTVHRTEQRTVHRTEFPIPGYKSFFKTRSANKQGGGVGFFVKQGLNVEILENLSFFDEHIYESLVIKVEIEKDKWAVFVSLYRPNTPVFHLTLNQQLDFFLQRYKQQIDEISKLKTKFFIMTDANLNLFNIQNDEVVENYIQYLSEKGAKNVISKATQLLLQAV